MLYACACSTVCVDIVFFFQAEDGIRDLVRSRGLGDVYKRQGGASASTPLTPRSRGLVEGASDPRERREVRRQRCCLLYTSDAADERSSVDLGGRRIIKKKNRIALVESCTSKQIDENKTRT